MIYSMPTISNPSTTQGPPPSRRDMRDAFLKGEPSTGGGSAPRSDGGGVKGRIDPVRGPPSGEKMDSNRSAGERERDYQISAVSGAPQYNGAVRQSVAKESDTYIGFANLPNQVYRKAVKKGFEFTLMVVGESGVGKSTLINSMFLTDIYHPTEHPGPSMRLKKTVQVEKTHVLLKEGGVQLRLTVVDTPGFGDSVDNSNCWQPLTDYIESEYESYLNEESRVNRKASLADHRVHCCLYFISPNGHGLKPLDVEAMKRLHDKVNIVPVIAKADTMTVEECRDFKKTILNEIARHKIRIYEFPDCDDEEEKKLLKKLRDRVPFTVVASNTIVDCQGRKVRGRVYPWGVVEVENLEHNDFLALRNMLFRTHLQDLKEVTNNVHYENYRFTRLASVGPDKNGKTTNKSPMVQMDEEKREHVLKLKKMEAEMEQVFETKVREKKNKLKESEIDLQRRAEQMKKGLEQQERELVEKRAVFEQERDAWEEQQRVFDAESTTGTLKKERKKLF